jgi:hypothetical protein
LTGPVDQLRTKIVSTRPETSCAAPEPQRAISGVLLPLPDVDCVIDLAILKCETAIAEGLAKPG